LDKPDEINRFSFQHLNHFQDAPQCVVLEAQKVSFHRESLAAG
jgi:hypothetical protein